MKIFKNTYQSHQESSQGFSFHASRMLAIAAMNKFKKNSGGDFNPDSSTEQIDVTPTKKGIISALNEHAGHNDNG
jgi:hypothetical protein